MPVFQQARRRANEEAFLHQNFFGNLLDFF